MKNIDRWNKVYEEKLYKHFRQFSEEELDKILARFPHVKDLSASRQADAYDLGCGRGEFLLQLKKRNIRVYGVEISDEVKSHAHKEVKDLIEVSDLNHFNPHFSVDIIFLKFVIAFIEDDNFLRNLKPYIREYGGIVILSPVGNIGEPAIPEEKLKKMFAGFNVEEEIWYQGDGVKLSLFALKSI